MDILTGSNDLGTLGLGLLIAGAVAGLVAGLLGRGAGLILVSALFLVGRAAGLTPDPAIHLAIGTSFLCLLPLALARAAAIKPAAISRPVMLPALLGLLASAGGLTLVFPVSGLALVCIFAAVAVVAAALLVAVKEPQDGRRRGGAIIVMIGSFVAGLIGLGGTALTGPALRLAGWPREEAEATAAGYAIPIVAGGAAVALWAGFDVHGLPRMSYGYVNLLAFGIAAPVALVCQLIAGHFADLIDTKRLKWLVAAFVVFSAVRMVWSVIG